MLPERLKKVKAWLEANKKDAFTAAFIFLVGMGSFGLGRLSVIWPEKGPITVTDENGIVKPIGQNGGQAPTVPDALGGGAGSAAISASIQSAKGKYIASKSGSYYHFPWCAGALRIKETNKIWFQTKAEAEGRGLKPASNCPGL